MCFPNIHYQFAARSQARREGMQHLFQKYNRDFVSQKLFRFTDWPTIKAYENMFEVPWYLADGTEARLFE
jgi:hypothetical protein